MSLNEKGFSAYTVISIILFLALVFVLALPNFFNLDKTKNEEDCINNMKLIWVASTDYMRDNLTEFNGDLNILLNQYKKSGLNVDGGQKKSSSHYLEKLYICPEDDGTKQNYTVFSKFMMEEVSGTRKLNCGSIIVCPNLAKYPKHFIQKSFYENMEPTEIQNYFIDDLDAINTATGMDGQSKLDMITKYISIWRTDPSAITRIRADNAAIRNQVLPSGTTVTQ
jgi:hypothetical protein